MSRRPYAVMPSFLSPALSRSLDEMFGQVNTSLGTMRDSILSPMTDVREASDHYSISVDMPGVSMSDINVEVNDGILSIEGSRRGKTKQDSEGAHRVERFMGTFQRRFSLPDNVDFEAISATCSDGVLEVKVPKLPERAPRRIKVETRINEGGEVKQDSAATADTSTQDA